MAAIASHGAHATTPRTLWRGVDRVIVSCAQANAALCRAVVEEAGRGAPYPITSSSPQARATARDVVLVVDAQRTSAGLSFSIQARRDDPRAETAADLAGVSSRAVRVAANADASELSRAVAASLDQLLPWRRASRGPRPR